MTGLRGAGLTLKNGGEVLAVARDGTFSFKTQLAAGESYDVMVGTQPSMPSQTCVVTRGAGSVEADVTDITVECATLSFKVGGEVVGLTGSGLVLENGNADALTINANGQFTFATAVPSGNAFAVTVTTQPSMPKQTCTVTGAAGTVGSGDVTSVMVNCAKDKFAVGGQVTGLSGGSLTLQNNAGDDLVVSGNGAFAFSGTLESGAGYAVTVKANPTSPTQTCSVASGVGSVESMAISSVRVVCSTNSYKVGGTVTGLTGAGLVLQNNAGDNLSISADGAFQFPQAVASGASFTVSALAQPSTPTQECVIAGATGVVGNADVTNVAVTCTTSSFKLGGSVTGLAGAGLVLTNNGGDALTVAADGSFEFATSVASGGSYAVAVSTQPSSPTQTCSVSGNTGTIGSGNVTSVLVNCTTNTYALGGSVTGLQGTLVLQNAGAELTLTQNGSFAFGTPIASGASYAVSVKTNPSTPSQTCVVSSGTGTVAASDIASVSVACTTNKYTVGGTVTGLASNESVVLRNNDGADLSVSANGDFNFAAIDSGSAYEVTVHQNPSAPVAQTCSVTSASGVVGGANVSDVVVTCTTNTYLVGGTVSGLLGSVVLQNGSDSVSISQNGSFSFPVKVASGSAYLATVFENPSTPSQTCVVSDGGGTVAASDVTSIAVVCTTNTYKIRGTVTGLAGTGLVLQNNGGDDLAVTQNGEFVFDDEIASGADYEVEVLTNPSGPTQTCTVTGGAGSVGGGDVTSVTVNCETNKYTVSGTVTGLAGTGLVLQNNGASNLSVTAAAFSFATTVASGATYNVTVLTQPSSPWQSCTVANGSGGVTNANITNVAVTCTTNRYTVSGTVSGLVNGGSLVLRNNGADNLTVNANGGFVFNTSVLSGGAYAVTVFTNPSKPRAQSCAVTSGSGAVAGANVAGVQVTCTNTAPKCSDLLTTQSVWGMASVGVAISGYTNGTLDWIGSPTPWGSFFCNDEANGISFGAATGTLRALVDPGNAGGDAYPTSWSNCCNASRPRDVCNAPRANNSGVGGINAGNALCKAMGFTSGVVISEGSDNWCPKPHTTDANGSNWTSSWNETDMVYAYSYRCTK